jgi:hypothetical protein
MTQHATGPLRCETHSPRSCVQIRRQFSRSHVHRQANSTATSKLPAKAKCSPPPPPSKPTPGPKRLHEYHHQSRQTLLRFFLRLAGCQIATTISNSACTGGFMPPSWVRDLRPSPIGTGGCPILFAPPAERAGSYDPTPQLSSLRSCFSRLPCVLPPNHPFPLCPLLSPR